MLPFEAFSALRKIDTSADSIWEKIFMPAPQAAQ
jgi:hypothetical protein